MSKDKKNNSSAPQKRASWLKRLFFGGSKTYADEVLGTDKYGRQSVSDVEAIVSPGKQIVKNFFRRKLAVAALILLVLMFAFAYIGPIFIPKYYNAYNETTQKSIPPINSMLDMPAELQKDIKSVSSYGPFTVGLSNAGDVYVWGSTVSWSDDGYVDLADIPEEVKNANILYAAAGYDHAIAIDDTGKIYGWGFSNLGQYGRPENAFKSAVLIPEDIYNNGVDVANVKKLICGYQVTAILMNDGTVYIWGNNNACENIDYFATINEYALFEKILIEDIAFTGSKAIAIRKAPDDGSEYSPILQGVSVTQSYLEVKSSYDKNAKPIPLDELLEERNATIVAIDATYDNAVYTLSDNSIWYAGSMFNHQANSFIEPPALEDGEYYVSITAGVRHYAGVTNLGNVHVWGEDILDQCTTPSTLKKASKVFASGFQTYTVDENGELVQKWGNKGYTFGTDSNGKNILHRIIIGSRTTLTAGIVAVVISTIIGIIIGCISGYFGGKVDMFLMRVTEIFSAIPFLPFAMILSSFMAKIPDQQTKMFLTMCILGFLSWTGLARLIRGQVLVARENEYVTAAKSMGVKESKIAFKHILPNVISVIIVTLTLDFASCMLTESSLSYLGYGIQGEPTWGNMLNSVRNIEIIKHYWWQWLFTSIFLATTTICINIIGDALRDVMDPKSSAER